VRRFMGIPLTLIVSAALAIASAAPVAATGIPNDVDPSICDQDLVPVSSAGDRTVDAACEAQLPPAWNFPRE